MKFLIYPILKLSYLAFAHTLMKCGRQASMYYKKNPWIINLPPIKTIFYNLQYFHVPLFPYQISKAHACFYIQ